MMVRKVMAIAVAYIMFSLQLAAAAPRDAELSLVNGAVMVKFEDVDDWVAADDGMPLSEGDQVWVAEGGRAEMLLKDGGAVRLDEGTQLDILALDKEFCQLFLAAGDVYVNIQGGRKFVAELETPAASFQSSGKVIFRVAVSDEGDAADLSVFKGSVLAETKHGRRKVEAGKSLYIEDSAGEFVPMDPSDEWEEWNRGMDQGRSNSTILH